MMWKTSMAALVLCVGAFAGAARGDDELRQSVAVESGGELVVDLDHGDIEIDSHDEAVVRIEAESAGAGLRFKLTSDGKNARLRGEHSGFWWRPRVRVHVRVPEQYDLRVATSGGNVEIEDIIGDVNVKSSGGRIEVSDVRGSVAVVTSGGRVRVEDVDGDVSARSSGGPIRVGDVSGKLDLETSGGGIDALDVAGPLLAQTSGGSIAARFLAAAAGHLETSGGSIEVEFDEDLGVDLDARTSGGRVRLEEGIAFSGSAGNNKVRGALNGGGPELVLKTSGGNIRVRLR